MVFVCIYYYKVPVCIYYYKVPVCIYYYKVPVFIYYYEHYERCRDRSATCPIELDFMHVEK